MDDSAEVAFAQRLASNEKTVRDRALKALRKYLSSRGRQSDLTREDMRKLWKGLHYSMWMQDKPLLQEELSARICSLLKIFDDGASAMNFAAAFFATQANEWNRLDQWRMDKFMMLTRDFLHATLEALKNRQWEQQLMSTLAQLIDEEVMAPEREENPDGLRLHVADIFLHELAKVGAEELTGSQISTLLTPFISYIAKSTRDTVRDKVTSSIFLAIVDSSSATQDDEEVPRLQYDIQAIRKQLFDEGKKPAVRSKARRKIYQLVQRFDSLSEKKPEKRKLTEDMEPPKKKKKKVAEASLATPEAEPPTKTQTPNTKTTPATRKTLEKSAAITAETETPVKTQTPKTKTPATRKIVEDSAVVVAAEAETATKAHVPVTKSTTAAKTTKEPASITDEEVSAATTETPTAKKTPKTKRMKTPKSKITKAEPAENTPSSDKKHVVFDLKRNSSRGLQEFVLSASDTPSPHLPGRSPRQGILKDSPARGADNTPSGKKSLPRKDKSLSAKGKKSAAKGKKAAAKGSKFEDMSGKGKSKTAKHLARKKARLMKKASRH